MDVRAMSSVVNVRQKKGGDPEAVLGYNAYKRIFLSLDAPSVLRDGLFRLLEGRTMCSVMCARLIYNCIIDNTLSVFCFFFS